MAIQPFDYSKLGGAQPDTPTEDTPTQKSSGIVPFDYSTLKTRTVTNDDNTLKEGANIAPTFTKTQKVKMGANLAYNALTEGMWGLPEAMVRSVPSLVEGLTKLSKYTDPNFYVGKVTGSKVAEETNRKNLEQAQKFTKLVKDNTAFLDEWKQFGEEYRRAEDAGVPEEFRNSLTGKVSSGVGSSASFLSTLLATRGLGMGAQFAGAGTKIGETLAILANTSQKLGIPLNTLAESQQIKEDTKQELLDMGKDDKEAERLATNVFGVSIVATPALDAIGLFNPAIKKTLVKKLSQFGIDIGSEVAQELTQTGAQNVATDKEFFANAKETTTVAGITSAIFSLLTKGHLSLKGEQAKPTATEPVVQADGTVTPPPGGGTPPPGGGTPTVGDIIANGQENYTQEEKVTAINNADFENNLVDPTNEVEAGTQEYADLKKDIKSALDEGASAGEVILKLREAYMVSQEYAENIVAEAMVPEVPIEVKQEVKVKTPTSVKTKEQILEDETVPRARKQVIEEIDFYLGASEAGYRQFTPEKDSYDYKVTAVPSTFPQWVPDNMRSRKVFDRLKPYWDKQERPSKKTPMLQKLYDLFQERVNEAEVEYQKKIDEQMAQEARGDGLEFKVRKTTVTPEMAVLDDFKKRYKLSFPTIIVDKILHGKKDVILEGGSKYAEGVTDGNTIALAFDAVANTGKHELIHLTLNNIDQIPELKGFTKMDILKAQAEKMGVTLTEDNMNKVEEQLALDFEAYKNKDYKPNNSILAKFFKAIEEMLKSFRGGIVKSDGNIITEYYDAVLYGETTRKQEIELKAESEITKYLINDILDYNPKYEAKRILSLSNGLTSVKFKTTEEKQPSLKEAIDKSMEVYRESGDLTTKILKDLEGKTTVSKQYILDATNRGDIKQAERDLIRDLLFYEGKEVNVTRFAEKVKFSLLPLAVNKVQTGMGDIDQNTGKWMKGRYEGVTLPQELRGKVADYREKIYESPIQTKAGDVHFNGDTDSYFGHTRIEDLPKGETRRVIEVQSDLFQKGRLEDEKKYRTDYTFRKKVEESLSQEDRAKYEASYNFINSQGSNAPESAKNFIKRVEDQYIASMEEARTKELAQLTPYRNTFWERLIREEVRQATIEGKTRLQFPTGETAMKIEGLGDAIAFNIARTGRNATIDTLKVGEEVYHGDTSMPWIITEVLGDGKFRAMPKEHFDSAYSKDQGYDFENYSEMITYAENHGTKNFWASTETFDISGKVDTNNPIYKFYEKDVARYLKNNYKAETVTDEQGVTWNEIKLNDSYKGAVLAFKERVTPEQNREEARKMFPRFTKLMEERKKAQQQVFQSEQKKSRAFERARGRLQEQYQLDTNYDTVKIVDEMAKAFEVLAQNPEYAKNVALGLEMSPRDVTDTAISLAVAETAKESGDYKLQADSEVARSLRQSRRGQEIVMEKGRVNENSSEFFIKQVLNRRKELVAQKYKPFMQEAKPFLSLLDEVKEKKMRKNNKIKSELEIKIEDLDSFLMDMAC